MIVIDNDGNIELRKIRRSNKNKGEYKLNSEGNKKITTPRPLKRFFKSNGLVQKPIFTTCSKEVENLWVGLIDEILKDPWWDEDENGNRVVNEED